MASPIDAAAEAADFSALIAEMEAEDNGAANGEAPGNAAEEPEEPAEEIEAEEPPAASADVEELRANVSALLEAGDLKAAAKALGVDPKIFNLNNRQFAANRKAAGDAARKATEAATTLATAEARAKAAENLQAAAEREYGVIAAGSKAYREGDLSGVRAAIEIMCKDTLENVTGKLARAAKGLDPGQIEVAKLRREIAERDAREKAAKDAAENSTAEAAQVSQISDKLKGSPLEGVDGAAQEIFALVRKSLHPTLGKYTKSLKDAYTEVLAAKRAQAAQLAKLAAPGGKPVADPRKPLPKTPLPKTPIGKKLSAEEEFKRELALAARDTEAQARKNRRVK